MELELEVGSPWKDLASAQAAESSGAFAAALRSARPRPWSLMALLPATAASNGLLPFSAAAELALALLLLP